MNARLELSTVAIRTDGCFSVLLWDGRPFAVSVERTFELGESSHGKRIVIPAGLALCTRTLYHRGNYATFEISVAGHSRVLFHKGNLEDHSEACVIVAESFGELKGKTAVLDSRGGFNEFMSLTAGLQQFYMNVTHR
jgi:hypothetical protein